jgi:DNA-directed RNA polymerase specialized sigma24 family protein
VTLTNETFDAARQWNPAALQSLLASGYAPARRIAHALSGHESVARAVANVLMQRCLRLLPKWRDVATAETWFYHHAVLTTRGVRVAVPEPREDPLVIHGAATEPEYIAFIRAMRHLPAQQLEAFILHHGERLNPRLLAVAMDCSMSAADTHLSAATEALRAVSGGHLNALSEHLTRAYAALAAAQPDANPIVRVQVRRVRRRIWLKRLIVLAILGAIAAGVVWWFRG